MPGGGSGGYNGTLVQLIKDGTVAESTLDAMVVRVLTQMYRLGIAQRPACPDCVRTKNVTSAARNAVARKVASASSVLLKNDGGLLPIDPKVHRKIAVIGTASDGDYNRLFGHVMTVNIGSGQVDGSRIYTPIQGIRDRAAKEAGLEIVHVNGNDAGAAAAAAKEADLAIVFVGTTSGEGWDRPNLNLNPFGAANDLMAGGVHQDALVAAVAAAQPSTVVVASSPGALLMPWAGAARAILMAWLPGQEFGGAIADLLFGDVCPSGRLPITMPNIENEVQMTPLQYPGLGDGRCEFRTNECLDPADRYASVAAPNQAACCAACCADGAKCQSFSLYNVSNGTSVCDLHAAAWIDPGTTTGNCTTGPQLPAYANYTERLEVGYKWYQANNKTPAYPFGHGT